MRTFQLHASIRNKLILTVGAGITLLMSAILAGIYISWMSIHVLEQDIKGSHAIEREVLSMQLDFKQQVQEWKDVLLRGSNHDALELHWTAFEKKENEVRQKGNALLTTLDDADSHELLKKFMLAHREMGVAYREGLQTFKSKNFDSRAGDEIVKGIDRAPTELLTQAADKITAHTNAIAKTSARSGYNAIIYGLIIAAIALLITTIGLALIIRNKIVQPIDALVVLMNKVSGEKNYALRAQPHSPDELGKLAGQFNDMLTQIQARDNALEQHKAHLEEEVAQRTSRLTEAQRIAHLGNWQYDLASGTLNGSDEIYRILGLTQEQFEGTYNAFLNIVYPDDRPFVTSQMHEALLQSQSYSIDHRILLQDGTIRHIHTQGKVNRDLHGNAVNIAGTMQDVTERKQVEERLRLAASVFTHAREGITITDAAGDILGVNDAFTRITGYSREESVGKNPRILNSGRQDPEYYASMWRELTETGHWTGEIWNRRKSGEVYAEMLTISAVKDAADLTSNYVALFSDISSIKQYQQQLEHIAHYDALTKLPNRVLLADRLQQAMIQSQRRVRSLAVLFLDLDGFKAVNDTYGHEAGDELLIEISQRMKNALREEDTLARIGGDEFVCVLVDLEQAADCEPVLNRLLQAASDPFTIKNATVHVSASIGVVLYPQDNSDADLLMRHADQAMYLAKQSGRNRYHLFDEQNETN